MSKKTLIILAILVMIISFVLREAIISDRWIKIIAFLALIFAITHIPELIRRKGRMFTWIEPASIGIVETSKKEHPILYEVIWVSNVILILGIIAASLYVLFFR